jgi:hypothetical protein
MNEAGLRDAVRHELELSVRRPPDGEALWNTFSRRCRDRFTSEQVAQGLAIAQPFITDRSVPGVEVRNVVGRRGEARSTYSPNEPWGKYLYEDGDWRNDGCDDP